MDAQTLWEVLFEMTGADRDDPLAYAHSVRDMLWRRNELLDNLKIKMLHFTGEGTDLRVGLSEKARFKGGSKKMPDGTIFTPNMPTYENFTTPDWRTVSGHARITKPSALECSVVHGLEVAFEEGRVCAVSAETEKEEKAYRSLIATDEGAAQLGEIALVGLDSPIAQSGMFFCNTLFDENAACHMATGVAYAACLEGGPHMSPKELEEIGCNKSDTHHDIMISDKTTTVIAHTHDDKEVTLLEEGHWTKEFA